MFPVLIQKDKEMKKRENMIYENCKSFQLENIEAFGIDEEWEFNLERDFFSLQN